MYEGERKRNIRSTLLSTSLKHVIIAKIESVLYLAKISMEVIERNSEIYILNAE